MFAVTNCSGNRTQTKVGGDENGGSQRLATAPCDLRANFIGLWAAAQERLSVGSAGVYPTAFFPGIQNAGNPSMSDGERWLKLIEEMVELKVELHAAMPAGGKPELLRLVAKKRHEDQQRLERVRAEILHLFDK